MEAGSRRPALGDLQRGLMRHEGWYSDPSRRHERRYWDGSAWTRRVQNGGVETADANMTATIRRPEPAHHGATDGLVKAGYWTAVLIAPVGFIIGIVLLTKDRTRHGVATMILAVVVTVIISASLAAAHGDNHCLLLADGGRKLCGADAAAWCDSTDAIRNLARDTASQQVCDDLRREVP